MPRPLVRLIAAAAALVLVPAHAGAHALAQRYDLPIPLGLFLAAAGATVAVSFVLLALFAQPPTNPAGARHDVPLWGPLVGITAQRHLGRLGRVIGVAAYLLILSAGFLGPQEPLKNLAPVSVWVLWWVGFAFLCAFIGNAWPAVNPWSALFEVVERSGGLPRRAVYPAWLGVWPAVGLLLVLLWMELVWEGAERPATLATAIVLYSLLTWGAMALFGREVWLRHGEVFNVFFALIGRFAPISAGDDRHPRWHLRLPGTGLLRDGPVDGSELAFILVVLAAVTYDGFLETPLWAAAVERIAGTPDAAVLDLTQDSPPVSAPTILALLGLIVAPLLLFLAFALAVALMTRLMTHAAEGPYHLPASVVARWFVVTLGPIAVAYHFAHYLSYLLLAGQLVIPLVSDPLGLGWDLFGTVLYRLDIGIIDAKTVWYVAIGAIVIGHVIAVSLAHALAYRLFPPRAALLSQLPMLALMVLYTMSSLWILAQPVVTDGRLM